MGPPTGLGTKRSDLKTAPALGLQNNALDPPTFDIATMADPSIADCPSLFIEYHGLAIRILIPIASLVKSGIFVWNIIPRTKKTLHLRYLPEGVKSRRIPLQANCLNFFG
jgi:hypothetical protein